VSSFNPTDVITKLTFSELSMLAQACNARMAQLQAEGIRKLAEHFEQQSLEQVGLSAKAVLAALGKKRGRPSTKNKVAEDVSAVSTPPSE
jgi:proline racemase